MDLDPLTGTLRWEMDLCPRCGRRTTFWFLEDGAARCAECEFIRKAEGGIRPPTGLSPK